MSITTYGTIEALSFVGSGSGLTQIPLTGLQPVQIAGAAIFDEKGVLKSAETPTTTFISTNSHSDVIIFDYSDNFKKEKDKENKAKRACVIDFKILGEFSNQTSDGSAYFSGIVKFGKTTSSIFNSLNIVDTIFDGAYVTASAGKIILKTPKIEQKINWKIIINVV